MRTNVRYFILRLLPIAVFVVAFALIGCDRTSRRDLHRAERMLKKAEKANAEFWAETEYKKAQRAFEDAMNKARDGMINVSRDKAAEAYLWAEEAEILAVQRKEEMDREKESLQGGTE